MSGPLTDSEVPAWWTALGLPGLFDIHVHFLPPRLEARVWEQFDLGGPLIGAPWAISYRGSVAERVDQLRALGVRHFSALSYAHRPDMAESLNDWAAAFAAEVPECLVSGTFYPEEGVGDYVERRVEAGVQVWKVHAQVGGFDLADPVLDPAWGALADAGTPVVVHAGSMPVGTAYTGPRPLAQVLRRHPRLTAVVAHLGAPEYAEFLDLAEAHERVHLDVTMCFTDFGAGFPEALLPRLRALGDKVLLGSDFPTIPYPYARQLAGLERLGWGDDWLRAVCWENGHRLVFG